jgi:hypothetical protein
LPESGQGGGHCQAQDDAEHGGDGNQLEWARSRRSAIPDPTPAAPATAASRSTIAAFKKILDHPGLVGTEPIGALAHLGLARAYATAGDASNARAEYRDFLALWKEADPDVPILKQAKAEYAKII